MTDITDALIAAGTASLRAKAKQRRSKPDLSADPDAAVYGLAPARKKRSNPEEAVSVAIRQAIRYALPSAFTFHLPNETDGSRNAKLHLIRRKARGVVSGVPDLCILWPGGGIAWLEVKAPGKRASETQEHIHGVFRAAGQHVATVDSVDAALAALRAAGAPLRAAR